MGDSLNCESSARQRAVSKLKSVGQKLKSVVQRVTGAIRETVSEFLQSSSLHGLQYIGTRSLIEKILWVAVVIASMTCCYYQIQDVYQKWRENPIVIAYDQKLQSVTDIPFPAVTVCVPLVVNGSSFDLMATLHKLNNSDESESNPSLVKLFNMVSSTCVYKAQKDMIWHYVLRHYWIEFDYLYMKSNSTLSSLFKIIESDLDKVGFKNCRGVSDVFFQPRCVTEFERIDTPEGACFSYNILNRDTLLTDDTVMGLDDRISIETNPRYWSPEDGYADDGYIDNYRRILKRWHIFPEKTYDHNRGFEFDLEFERWDSQFKCFDKPHLYIHHPHDLPWRESDKIDLSDGSKIKISVTPEITLTDATLRTSSTPEQRGCYFDDEVQLRYFKIYSESNCQLECFSNLTWKRGNCVPFWMPRDKGMRVCNALEAYNYLDRVISLNLDTVNNIDGYYYCFPCLPRCNSITYNNFIADRSKVKDETVVVSSNELEKFLFTPEMLEDEFFDYIRDAFNKADDPSFDRKRLEIVFAKSHVLALKRSPRYQTFDFIASVGGLLGLFIGMSLLSLVEVLYFLTVRLIEKCCRRRSTDRG